LTQRHQRRSHGANKLHITGSQSARPAHPPATPSTGDDSMSKVAAMLNSEQIDSSNAYIKVLLDRLQSQSLELDVLRRQSNRYKDSDVEALMSELEHTKKQLCIAEDDIAILLRDKRGALAQSVQFKKVESNQESRIRQLEHDRDDALEKLRTSTNQCIRTNETLDSIRHELSTLQQQHATTLTQLATQTSTARQYSCEIVDLHNALQREQAEREFAENEREKWKEQYTAVRMECDELEQKLEQEQKRLSDERSKVRRLTTERTEALDRADREASRAIDAEATLCTLQDELAATQQEVAASRLECKDLSEHLSRRIAEAEVAHHEYAEAHAKLSASLDEMTSRAEKAEQQHSSAIREVSTLIATHANIRANLASALDREKTLNIDLTYQLADLKKELDQRDTRIRTQCATLEKHESTIDSLQQRIWKLEGTLATTTQQLTEVTESLRTQSQIVTSKLQEISNLKEDNTQLRDRVINMAHQLETFKDEQLTLLANHRLDIQRKDATIQRAEWKVNQQTTALKECERRLAEVQDRLEGMESQAAMTTQQAAAAAVKSTKELERTKELYESTRAAMEEQQSAHANERQKLLDEVAMYRGRADVLSTTLDSLKLEQETLQHEHQRLVSLHRELRQKYAESLKQSGTCETSGTGEWNNQQLLNQQEQENGSAAVSRRHSLNHREADCRQQELPVPIQPTSSNEHPGLTRPVEHTTTPDHRARSSEMSSSQTPSFTPPPAEGVPNNAVTIASRTLATIPIAVGLLFQSSESSPHVPTDGLLVTSIKAGQAAEAAFLKVGDVLHAINNQQTCTKAAFLSAIKGLQAGDQVPMRITRQGEEMSLSLIVYAREKSLEEVNALRKQAQLPVFTR